MSKSNTSERSLESCVTANPEETRAWGLKLARRLQAGDCLLLIGELGAGKTTLVQGIASGFGVPPEKIRSPTFVLIREYDGQIPIYHVDAYRLRSAEELLDVGFEDYLASGRGLVIVEWGEVVRPLCPPDSWEVRLEILDEHRRRLTSFLGAHRRRKRHRDGD
ncbi:MAG TPA: tRNA (adenosine(37)-N6)-threonylcarbamoyltransferase complex ATPase subunit type 1 TsaE [Candidatus Fraserbacteria bacterium]|nr:tRNA (adenosine(37)-N6)-threonylcarbamoyltransferase complex ATPase subunit type 1 TsaE [Candidatus Fraserbacteria bacterium]